MSTNYFKGKGDHVLSFQELTLDKEGKALAKNTKQRGGLNMITKKGLVNLMFLLLLAFVSVNPYPELAFAQKEAQILKIGCFNPRTGPAAAWGINTGRGLDLCVDEWNKKGGVTVQGQKYKIEMIYEDDKVRGEEAVKAANKLIYTDKVKFLAGLVTSPCILAAAPMIEANKIITVADSFSVEVLKDRKYLFRCVIPPIHAAPAFFKFVNKIRPDLKTSVHITPNNAGGWDATQGDNDACHALGMKVLASEFIEYGTQDFTSMLARVIPLKPDFISTASTPPAVLALIIKQARELGYKGQFVHSSFIMPAELGPIAGWENIEGMITGDIATEGANVPQSLKKVYNDWVVKYGEGNAGGFPLGISQYDAINIICRGIEKADSLDADKVVAGIENLGTIDTIFGKARWGGHEDLQYQPPASYASFDQPGSE